MRNGEERDSPAGAKPQLLTGFSQVSHRFLTAFLTDPEQPDFISHRFLTEPAHRFLTGKMI